MLNIIYLWNDTFALLILGIPFLNLANEEKVKGILEKKNNKCSETTGRKLTGISPDEEEFVNNTVYDKFYLYYAISISNYFCLKSV